MKKFIKNFFSIIFNTIFVITILIFIILLYSYIQVKLMKKEYPNVFGYTAFQVATGSMQNTIHIDDIVLVKLYNQTDTLKKDDIVVFKEDEYIITHRIIEINDNNIITKGDANNTCDEPIAKENLIGIVKLIVPNIAIWKRVLTSPEIILLIIITFNLWIIVFSIKDKKTDEDKIEKKRTKE